MKNHPIFYIVVSSLSVWLLLDRDLTTSNVWNAIQAGREMDKSAFNFDRDQLQRVLHPFIITAGIVHILYCALFSFLSVQTLIFTHAISALAYGIAFSLFKKNYTLPVFIIISLDVFAHALISSELIGVESNFLFYLLSCGVFIFLYSSLRLMYRLIWFELLFLAFLTIDYVFQNTTALFRLSEAINLCIRYFNIALIFLSLGWITHTYRVLLSSSIASTTTKADADLTDHLTGLFKRETVLKRIDEILTTIGHDKQTMSIIILDIDNAAEIKSKYGNPTLDAVLMRMAEALKSAIRYNDRASRWGGNEFMLLLPGGNKGSALRISERIKQQLSSEPLSINNHNVSLSLSFGIAEMASGEDFNACLIRSEKALKMAKQGTDGNIYVSSTSLPVNSAS